MLELVTEDGSRLGLSVSKDSHRISLVVFPSELSPDEDGGGDGTVLEGAVWDVFQCALAEETAKRLHKCLQKKKPFRCIATDFRVISYGDKLEMLFKRDFAPGYYRAILPANASKTFRLCIEDALAVFQGIEFVSKPYRGFKVPCPSDFNPHTFEMIQQAMADQNVAPSTEADFWFESGIYLFQAPRELFEGGSLAVSRKCFELALETWSPQAACKLDDIRVNLASTLSVDGQGQAALALLEKVADRRDRFWAIQANCFQSLGRHDEAVGAYERAIEMEPSFYLPHVRILGSLREIASERYEFYLELAVSRFREYPWVAFYWAEHLFRCNRLAELEDASWIDLLASKEESRVAPNPREDQELILRAQQFRAVGKAQAALLRFFDQEKQEDRDLAEVAFTAALAALRPLDLRHVSCDPAKALLVVGSLLGKVDSLASIQRSICSECQAAGTGLFGPLEAYEARAWLSSGKDERAVEYADRALTKECGNLFALESLMMALDNLGQTERACVTARQIEACSASYPFIKRHIGRLFLQNGELAKARVYLEAWLAESPDDLSMLDQLVCLELLDHRFDQAEVVFEKANLEVAEHIVMLRDTEIDSSTGLLLRDKRRQEFQELLTFARCHDSAPEYGRLILHQMKRSGVFAPLFAKLKPSALDIAELFARIVNAPSHLDLLEFQRELSLHQKGDHSGLAVQLEQKVGSWDSLPDAARLSLLEATRSVNRGESIDYAPSVVAAAKAVEVTLKALVFEAFRAWLIQQELQEIALAQATELKYEKVSRLRDFIVKNAFLELGGMLFILRLSTGRTARECALLQMLGEFLSATGMKGVLANDFIDPVEAIARQRNQAAHSGNVVRQEAEDLLERVFSILGAFAARAELAIP